MQPTSSANFEKESHDFSRKSWHASSAHKKKGGTIMKKVITAVAVGVLALGIAASRKAPAMVLVGKEAGRADGVRG